MDQQFNPFQSPKLAPPASPLQGAMTWNMPFESGRDRARWAIALLALSALLSLVATAVGWNAHQAAMERGAPITVHDPEWVPAAIVGGLDWLVWIPTVVMFCMWTHRVARNLPALGGRGLRFTPAWAVAWFFIPVANFVMPYLVFGEIWRESDPQQRDLGGPGRKRTSPLVAWWWGIYAGRWALLFAAMFVSGIVGGYVGAKSASKPGATPQDVAVAIHRTVPWLDLTGIPVTALAFVAAILAIFVVRRIDQNQQAKYDLILNEPTVI